MEKAFLKRTANLLQTKYKRKQWQKLMVSLSLVVVLLTSCLLIHPAITMERKANCGQEEHTHTKECYEQELICGKEESDKTESSDETEGAEAVEAHTHSDACYKSVLICGKQEHKHTEACYPKETEEKEETSSEVKNIEEEKSEEKTEKAEARTLKVEQADYAVEVDCPAEANIPKDAVLKVRAIKKGTAEYNGYYQKTLNAVKKGDETDIFFARFFDISFIADGKEIEPEAEVSVKITYDDKVSVPESGDVKSIHFGDNTELLKVKTNENNGKIDEVQFDARSFSVYGIVGLETPTGDEKIDESKGTENTENTYLVYPNKIKVYVYVAAYDTEGNAWKDNPEFLDLLGIDKDTVDNNNYFPAGEIELDASFLNGKESAAATPGMPLITSNKDWQDLLVALSNLNTTTLTGKYAANQGNHINEYLSQAAGDIGYTWGSQHTALFRWNMTTSYGFDDQTVEYHLDLRFNTNKITFITGNNRITTGDAEDGTTVDTRVYITGSAIQEPRNLNIPEGYRFVGYYTDSDFTTPWNGIGTPLNEDQTVYIKITPLDNVILYYKNVSENEAGSLSSDSEGLNPVTGVARGSTAVANEGYEFVGWYADEECTELLSTDSKYVPTKPGGGKWIDGTTFYAKFKPVTINVTVSKIWKDDDNKYCMRPESVSIQLKKNGKIYEDTVKLNESNHWTYTWKDLPKIEAGESVSYDVEELPVDGYTSEKSGNTTDGFIFTNTIKKIKVSFKKTDMGTTPLSGAEFKATFDGISYSLTSGDDGILKDGDNAVFELPVSNTAYELTEETAPPGYSKLAGSVEVHVNVSSVIPVTANLKGTTTQFEVGGPDENDVYTVSITNSEGVELPHTGDSGTFSYTLSGLLLICAAGLMYGFSLRCRCRRR